MADLPTAAHSVLADARVRRYALIGLAVALVLAVWGIVSRISARNALEREAAAAAVPTVATVTPKLGPGSDTLVLPGSVQAFYEAPIYARTSGYLKNWYTDIGAAVKKGQVLAEIDTPEVDQQLRQAEADLATADANYELARTTNERWKGLRATESVSQQDADQRAGDAAAKAAARQSAAANLARLKDLESFKRVAAPFESWVPEQAEALLRECEEDVVLAREVAVDRGGAVLDALGNLADGDVAEPFGHEELPGGVENRAPYCFAVAFLPFFDAHMSFCHGVRHPSDPNVMLTSERCSHD